MTMKCSYSSTLMQCTGDTRLGTTRELHVGRVTIPAELCQPKQIVLIQVSGERVLSENKLKRKRQSDQRRQEVIGGKRFEKNAHGRREESKRRQEKA